MPINPYMLPRGDAEKNLHEDLIIEAIKGFGLDVYYIPRKIIVKDDIINEVLKSDFKNAFKVEVYLESFDSYEGDGQLMSKFGLEIRDQVRLVMTRRRWKELVARFVDTHDSRPLEGDLIYFPMINGLFEVKYVDGTQPFYQMANMPVYKMNCELFEYSDEKMDTGVDEIDQIGRSYAAQSVLTIEAKSGTFKISEVLVDDSQDSDGIVSLQDLTTITVVHTEGDNDWAIGDVVTGLESGASATVVDVQQFTNMADYDPSADNAEIEDEANPIIDFSERNPFGEPDFIE